MASLTTPLGVLVAGAGGVLVYMAATGQNPAVELRKALTTGRLDGPPDPTERAIDVVARPTLGSPGGFAPNVDDDGFPPVSPNSEPNLVKIGQGGHRLRPVAASAFRQAEQNYGRTIRISDSYRSYVQQRADYNRDPSRFGHPDESAHVEGRAVDVDLGALGIVRGTLDEPAYRRLVEAMYAAGWCNYQLDGYDQSSKISEPWHFSYKVCK